MNKPVAIIMPVRGRPELTEQTIETIYRNTTVPFKLYVCDDDSKKDVKDVLARLKEKHGFTLLTNKTNLGITPTKERLIDAIDYDYEYLYVTDNDYWYRKGWLEMLLHFYYYHDDIMVIGGTTYPLHKIKEVRWGVITTEIQTGGTMLLSRSIVDLILAHFDGWTQDWNWSKLVQDYEFEVAHLANLYYVLHCGINMVSGRLDADNKIQGKKHVGAEAYLKTLAERVGAKYD